MEGPPLIAETSGALVAVVKGAVPLDDLPEAYPFQAPATTTRIVGLAR
jgi:hypothetical protein